MNEAIFHRSILSNYNIIPKPGVYKVRVANNVIKLHDENGSHPRYLVHLRAGTMQNLIQATQILDDREECSYDEVKHLFLSGALWPNQIEELENLPVKGEEVLVTITEDETGVYRCSNIALIPRQPLEFFDYTEHCDLLKTYSELLTLCTE